jgi:hypothetical protein
MYVTRGADKQKTKLQVVLSQCFVLLECSKQNKTKQNKKQKKTAVKYKMEK